ncbi:MAG: formyltetrahydrofolate deformylase, partial [Litorivicinaceae bacterium]
MNTEQRYLLRITCPGRTGLVAAITGFLADQHCFITELSQFDDIQTGRFFCRAEFFKPESGLTSVELSDLFAEIGSRFEMD